MRKGQRVEIIFGDSFFSENYLTITLDEKQSNKLIKLAKKQEGEEITVLLPDYEDE